MHFRLYVTFDRSHAINSMHARAYAYDQLGCDPKLFGRRFEDDTRIGDWFVIGGRWSGHLQLNLMDKSFFKEAKRAVSSLDGQSGDSVVEKKRKLHQGVWRKFGGKDVYPHRRDRYRALGYTDDAMIVTSRLYEMCLKEHEVVVKGNNQQDKDQDWLFPQFIDLDDTQLSSERFVGKKWIVLVDYHS